MGTGPPARVVQVALIGTALGHGHQAVGVGPQDRAQEGQKSKEESGSHMGGPGQGQWAEGGVRSVTLIGREVTLGTIGVKTLEVLMLRDLSNATDVEPSQHSIYSVNSSRGVSLLIP